MPEMLIEYLGAKEDRFGNLQGWNVKEIRGIENAYKERAYLFTFNASYPRWSCSCTPQDFQYPVPNFTMCRHAAAVFRDISRRPGPWEADSTLMSIAWEALNYMARPISDESPINFLASTDKATGPDRTTFQFIPNQTSASSAAVTIRLSNAYVGTINGYLEGEKAEPPPAEPKKPRSRFSEIDL